MKHFHSQKRLLKVFIQTSALEEVAFRSNFVAKLCNTALSLAGSIGAIYLLFQAKSSIHGWSFYEVLILTAIFMLLQSLISLFLGPSLNAISGLNGELWTGQFDFTLLKPVSTQLCLCARHWSLLSMIDLIISIVLLLIGAIKAGIQYTPTTVLLFIYTLFIAVLLLYSIMLILSSVAFWYLGTPLLWIFNSFMELGRYPVNIYPAVFRNLLTWILPVGLMITIPAQVLTHNYNIIEIIFGTLFAITLYTISIFFLKASIRHYSSASS
ncbi:MAG: ABC-2 family transporter protein [Clostridiales bacterium]|nr:ABC-2 family transporter protein [Clostridiales bacterium]